MKTHNKYREEAKKRAIEELKATMVEEMPVGMRFAPLSGEVTEETDMFRAGDYLLDLD